MWNLAARRIRRTLFGIIHPSFLPIVLLLIKNLVGFKVFHLGASAESTDAPPETSALSIALSAPTEMPPILFQTWKSRTNIPSNYNYWRRTFIRQNPNFNFILWDDDDNRNFITTQFPWFLPIYNSYPKEIFRADAIRPFFLYRYGGFYADMDSECLRPLDRLMQSGDILLGRMGADTAFEHSIPNAIMASKPFQLFWLLFIAMMIEKAHEKNLYFSPSEKPEVFTGPILLKEAVDLYNASPKNTILDKTAGVLKMLPREFRERSQIGHIKLLEPDVFYPIDWTNPIHRMLRSNLLRNRMLLDHDTACNLFPRSSVVTYWSHSW